jgi:glycosyltransferase involved in cell wall biosynthesis
VIQNGVAIFYFHAEILGLWPGVSYAFWRAVKERVASYDVVHSHSLWLFAGLVIGHYCRKYGVPYLIRPCGAMDPYIFRRHRWRKELLERLYERRNFRHAAAIHFTTQEEMELARAALHFSRGIVIPLGLWVEDYRRPQTEGTFRRLFPEVGQRRIILFLSRLNFKKGLDLLIPAVGKLSRRRDLTGKVTLTGMLQGDAKLAVLQDAEMLVLPSYSENFGVAVVEAMACGLPVVISDKVNIWREVESAKAGLVTACDPTEIARAIEFLLDDPQEGHKMGRNGRKLVKNQYSWRRVATLLEDVYRELLAEGTRGRDDFAL